MTQQLKFSRRCIQTDIPFFWDAAAHHVRGRHKADALSGSKVQTGSRFCTTFSSMISASTMQRRCGNFLWLSPLVVLYFLTAHVPTVMLHPQCLDFKPPFRPMRELEFCVMYKEFGCCDYQRDQELMAKYYQIMDRFDYSGFESCAGYVLDLLCQVGMRTKVAALVGYITSGASMMT